MIVILKFKQSISINILVPKKVIHNMFIKEKALNSNLIFKHVLF